MGTPEFPDLGMHCSVDDCRLIDFLPFTCDRCNQVFCLQHRSYTGHHCPNANQNDVTVLICPLCAKGVRLVPNQDPNITWDSHVNTDCDPSNYQKATKKRRCPVPGCRETLTFSNTIRCRDCTQEHCLKHRFGPDHKCRGPKKLDTSLPFLGLFRSHKSQSVPNCSSSGSTRSQNSNGSSWWGSGLLNAVSSFRASAEAGMQRMSSVASQAMQKAKDGIAESSNGGELVEQCPQCPARFSSVSSLIEHAERNHSRENAQQGHPRITIDVCPKCNRGFQNPVSLVEHVEKEHGGTSID